MTSVVKKKSCCRRCYPRGYCGCCKPAQEQHRTDTNINVKANVEAAAIPYGFVNLFSGVRTQRSTFTCPILSVHLYRHTFFQADRNQYNQVVMVNRKNEYQTYQGLHQTSEEAEASAEEEVIMIPIEDITHISYKCEVAKRIGGDAHRDIDDQYYISENCCDRCNARIGGRAARKNQVESFLNNTTVSSDLSSNRTVGYTVEELPIPEEKDGCRTRCCDALYFRCRCWCCRKKKLIRRLQLTNKASEGYAQRMITVTVEYSKYSHLDSASNARLLSGEDQATYYREHFLPNTLVKFHLLNNEQIDPRNFDVTKRYAETLCRMVTQLKAMRDHYPSPVELQTIIQQSQLGTFGEVYNEPSLELGSGMMLPGTSDPQHQQLHYLRGKQRPFFLRRNAPTYVSSPMSPMYITSPSPSLFRTPLPPPLPIPRPPPRPPPLMLMPRQ